MARQVKELAGYANIYQSLSMYCSVWPVHNNSRRSKQVDSLYRTLGALI